MLTTYIITDSNAVVKWENLSAAKEIREKPHTAHAIVQNGFQKSKKSKLSRKSDLRLFQKSVIIKISIV